MRNVLIVAVALFALFVLGALFAGGAAFYLLRVRAEESQVQAVQARVQARQAQQQAMQKQTRAPQAQAPATPVRPGKVSNKVAKTAPARTDFPLPPSKDGSIVERWEGYYYYSTIPLEQAAAQNIPRTRFWFDVKRSEQENFNATCNENSGLGDARIAGMFSRDEKLLAFDKTYTNQATSWHYKGKWNPELKRIEGNWGTQPNVPTWAQGGFVLYPRRLSEAEIVKYENQNQNQLQILTPAVDIFTPTEPLPAVPPQPLQFTQPPQPLQAMPPPRPTLVRPPPVAPARPRPPQNDEF